MTLKRKRRRFNRAAVVKRKKPESSSRTGLEAPDAQQTPQHIEVPTILPVSDSMVATGRCPIAKLPAELLTDILSYILANKQKPITLSSRTGRRWKNELHNLVAVDWNRSISVGPRDVSAPKVARSPLLDVLLVSKSFYFAGIAAFFGENKLQFDSVDHLDRLTVALDMDRRRCIRHIVFPSPSFNIGIIADRDLIEFVGDRLDVLFERLPCLQTCHITHASYDLRSERMLDWHAGRLTKQFEKLKGWAGKRGSQVLRLDIRDHNGAQVVPRGLVSYDLPAHLALRKGVGV